MYKKIFTYSILKTIIVVREKTANFLRDCAFYGKSMRVGAGLPCWDLSHLGYGPGDFGHFCAIYRPDGIFFPMFLT